MTDDTCPDIVEDWHGKATTPANPFKTYIRDARIQLLGAINRLRYSGTGIPTPPTLIDGTEADFLTAIAEWLESFNRKLIIISDTTTDMAAELDTLRGQQKAVRDFLGLDTPERNT